MAGREDLAALGGLVETVVKEVRVGKGVTVAKGVLEEDCAWVPQNKRFFMY